MDVLVLGNYVVRRDTSSYAASTESVTVVPGAVRTHALARGRAEPAPQLAVRQQPLEGRAERCDVARRHEQAGLAVDDEIAQAADIGGHDGAPVRHRLARTRRRSPRGATGTRRRPPARRDARARRARASRAPAEPAVEAGRRRRRRAAVSLRRLDQLEDALLGRQPAGEEDLAAAPLRRRPSPGTSTPFGTTRTSCAPRACTSSASAFDTASTTRTRRSSARASGGARRASSTSVPCTVSTTGRRSRARPPRSGASARARRRRCVPRAGPRGRRRRTRAAAASASHGRRRRFPATPAP